MFFYTEILQYGLMVYSVLIAPLWFLIAFLFRIRHRDVIFQWKRPRVVFYAIGLAILITGCILVCLYAITYSNSSLIFFSVFMFIGGLLTYNALSYGATILITNKGIVSSIYALKDDTILWTNIKDYYVHKHHPILVYVFIYDFYQSIKITIPYYMQQAFEELISIKIDRPKMYINLKPEENEILTKQIKEMFNQK
ncbi:MAG: hypothetical protein NZ455_15905 [Bacteroidia bacterium]|nr:hypothetical protein [Bacteroidia bacterium]MDW8348060.1 hypothetical protein [Bacteroidia bacterium]